MILYNIIIVFTNIIIALFFTTIYTNNLNYKKNQYINKYQLNINLPNNTILFKNNITLSRTMKWNKENLTWSFIIRKEDFLDIDIISILKISEESFNDWFKHIPNNIKYIRNINEADIIISFENPFHLCLGKITNRYNENYSSHASWPPTGIIHMYKSNLYTNNKFDLIKYKIILTHEIGHAIGLRHPIYSKNISSIMIGSSFRNTEITEYDIKNIKLLYN